MNGEFNQLSAFVGDHADVFGIAAIAAVAGVGVVSLACMFVVMCHKIPSSHSNLQRGLFKQPCCDCEEHPREDHISLAQSRV
ncbi:MAG: hypothetical protein A2X77_05910 [Gammaproteobacteria bacterium GWE2_42_36]|nr:MAG: hypothetical protein A2X77_05910 [Gammaproteobacteria bacterium GWE2_42_36]HCU05221.1 hypothetical protein [Coxiellaceae bacterium]